MSKVSVFLKRERLYILILVFVAIMTLTLSVASQDKAKHRSGTAGAGSSVPSQAAAAANPANDRAAVEKVLSGNRYLAVIVTMVTLIVTAVFLMGIVIDIIFLSGLHNLKASGASSCTGYRVSWGMWDVSKVAVLYLFFGYMMLISEAFLMGAVPVFKNDNFRMMLNSSVMDILIVFFILEFSVVQYKDKLEALGISAKDFFRNVRYGIAAYIAIVPVLIGLVALIAAAVSAIKYVPQKQPVVDLFLKERNTTFLLYTSLFAAIAGPMVEELFFRGFFYNAAKKRVGIFWATIVTASVFALLHAHLVGFLPILALGILLAYVYEKTGSLVSSVTVHMVHNLAMVFLVFLVKQIGVYR